MPRQHSHEVGRVGLLVCVMGSVVTALAAPAAARAAAVMPYSLQVGALTGPQGGLLRIEVDAGATVPAVTGLKYVQVSVNGQLTRVLSNVSAPGGVAEIELGPVPRGATVSAKFYVRDAKQALVQLGRATIARLRPDLVVAGVQAPRQTLPTRPIDVVADVSELNGDVGATATLRLMLGPTLLAEPKTVTVPPGGSVSVQFPGVNLTTAMSAELSVLIDEAVPFETNATNNAGSSTVEVTEHELVRSTVFVEALGGYGAQFNQHVYAPVTNPPVGTLPDLEAKVKALEPQLVRIFYNDNFEERQPNRVRNLAVVQGHGQAGSRGRGDDQHHLPGCRTSRRTIRPDRCPASQSCSRISSRSRATRGVRWVTVANEPNSTSVTMAQYEALYRALDAELIARGLDEPNQGDGRRPDPGQPADLVPVHRGEHERRARRVLGAHLLGLLERARSSWSPGSRTCARSSPRSCRSRRASRRTSRNPVSAASSTFRGSPPSSPGYWEDGTAMSRTNIAAFQQLWFDLETVQLGFPGSVKWDAYWGRYTQRTTSRGT